jgi:diguanylate cyclase (GGDEF)-like protein
MTPTPTAPSALIDTPTTTLVYLKLMTRVSRTLSLCLVGMGLFYALARWLLVSPAELLHASLYAQELSLDNLLWLGLPPFTVGVLLWAGHQYIRQLINTLRDNDLAAFTRLLLVAQAIQLGLLLVLYTLTQGSVAVLLALGFPGLMAYWLGGAVWARWMNTIAMAVVVLWLPFGYPTLLPLNGLGLLLQVLPVMLLYGFALRMMSQQQLVTRGRNDELTSMASTDTLTGLMNRRYFNLRLSSELSRARRYGLPLSLVLIDIDNFKHVNDTYGHTFGDRVLRELSQFMMANIRESDLLARYGGEELALILPNTKRLAAYELLERLRQQVASRVFYAVEDKVSITLSIGLTQFDAQRHAAVELIQEADSALYEAKHHGKNQVVMYGVHRPLSPSEAKQMVQTRVEPAVAVPSPSVEPIRVPPATAAKPTNDDDAAPPQEALPAWT